MSKDNYEIFLSYFRDDSGGWTTLLYQALTDALSPNLNVFKDDEETQPGEKWRKLLQRLVKSCDYFLLVITKDWNGAEIRQKLADENNWVRKEILAAQQHNKTIIPLLMNGLQSLPENLPADIGSIINSRQYFSFSSGSKKWESEVKKLCHALNDKKLDSIRKQIPKKLFSRLDRVSESSRVLEVAQQGNPVLSVCAISDDEPSIFAHRCAHEFCEENGVLKETPEVIEIGWGEFKGQVTEARRKKKLHQLIAAQCSTREELLAQYFSRNQQIHVFFTKIPDAHRAAPNDMNEWLEIWCDLLQHSRFNRIVVMLFFPSSIWFTPRPKLPSVACEHQTKLHQKGLSKVQRVDVQEFINELAKNNHLNDNEQQKLQVTTDKLFKFKPRGIRFKKVMDGLDIINDAKSPNSRRNHP